MLIGRFQQRIMRWPCYCVNRKSLAQRTGREITNRGAVTSEQE